MRGFSLRQLPRAEDLSTHDLWRALAVIAGINVLLLLVRPDAPRPPVLAVRSPDDLQGHHEGSPCRVLPTHTARCAAGHAARTHSGA